jgi:hypothetical protein
MDGVVVRIMANASHDWLAGRSAEYYHNRKADGHSGVACGNTPFNQSCHAMPNHAMP